MILKGDQILDYKIDKIWQFIVNTDNLAKCLPNVKKLEKIENGFSAKIEVTIGFLKGTFDSKFTYSEVKEPNYLKINGEAKGMGSFVKLSLQINLSQEIDKTKFSWVADVSITGPLASIGNRYINDVAEKIVNDLFSCMLSNLK